MGRVVACATLLAAAALCAGCSGCVATQQGYAPAQPIAFSHARHAGQYQLDCRYCHFGAERSRHAGVPPAQVCMNCHAQVKKESEEVKKVARAVETNQPIEWVRVHRFPDHAYFSHENHVGAGVKCQTCHGPVETMVRLEQVETMTMGWCLGCHRSAPRASQAGRELHATLDCSGCHR